MGVGGQHHAPAALPPGKNRCPSWSKSLKQLFVVLLLPHQFSSRTVFTPLSLWSHLCATDFIFLCPAIFKVPTSLPATTFTLFLLLSIDDMQVFTLLSLLNNGLPSTDFNLMFILNRNPCFRYCHYRTAVWVPVFVVVCLIDDKSDVLLWVSAVSVPELKVLGSNIDCELGYHDWSFSRFQIK